MPAKAANSRSGGGRTLLATILILVILLPLAYQAVSGVMALGAGPPQLFLQRPDPKHKKCVMGRDAREMRYHHWEHLRRVREEVVRFGKRGDEGLNKCMDCHTSRVEFCDKCHNAVSLSPDCFHCHYYP